MRADLTGKRFGKLTVVKYSHSDHNQKARWLCKCDCGKEITTTTGSLNIGDAMSCGCTRKKRYTKFYRKTHTAWRDMIDRCYNPDNAYYHAYGGRGIKVCDRWQTFEHFYDDMGEPASKELSLDKIDNNADYSPNNCRWTDVKTQSRNTRRNIYVTYKGETKCTAEWAEIFGLHEGTFRQRIHQGLTVDQILTIKPKKTSKYRGVHYKNGIWIAQIAEGKKKICIGRFKIEAEAALAYNRSASKIYGERAILNQL